MYDYDDEDFNADNYEDEYEDDFEEYDDDGRGFDVEERSKYYDDCLGEY